MGTRSSLNIVIAKRKIPANAKNQMAACLACHHSAGLQKLRLYRHNTTYIFWLNRSSLWRFLWSVDSRHGFCGFRGTMRPTGLCGGRGGAMGPALLRRLCFSKSVPDVHNCGSGIMFLGKNSPETKRFWIIYCTYLNCFHNMVHILIQLFGKKAAAVAHFNFKVLHQNLLRKKDWKG